ncbi:MAG: DedA family protein [Minisyncoccia bacterium]|jgi:membrane protein DedA with SNARE-associated domain
MPFASPIVSWLLAYRYPILYPLAIVEGPVVMMISGFLVRLNFFYFWPVYFLLIAGDLTGDILWYLLGRHGARSFIEKYGKFFSITEENVEKAEQFFNKHQWKILFISKITMGFGFALATLIAAGAAKVPFKKYLTINFLGQFVWTGVLMAVGYFLGNLYIMVDKSLRWAFIIALIVIAFFAAYGFGKFMRNRMRGEIE